MKEKILNQINARIETFEFGIEKLKEGSNEFGIEKLKEVCNECGFEKLKEGSNDTSFNRKGPFEGELTELKKLIVFINNLPE